MIFPDTQVDGNAKLKPGHPIPISTWFKKFLQATSAGTVSLTLHMKILSWQPKALYAAKQLAIKWVTSGSPA